MREAMMLPLPCSNVIQKVPVESSSLLLINMLLSFFQSPYLFQAGDRLSSAITTSYAILRTCRDLVARRHNLPRPLSVRISLIVTRALILHLAHTDILTQDEFVKMASNQGSKLSKKNETTDFELVEENSVDLESNTDNSSFLDVDDITSAVQTWSGNSSVWLLVWRHLLCVLGPHNSSFANAKIAVETLSSTIHSLLLVNLDPLAHWIASRLVQTSANLLPNYIASLGAVLSSGRQPSPILQTHILLAFIRLIKAGDPQVIPHVTSMSPRHLAVLSQHILQAVPSMIPQCQSNTHILKVLALLSSSSVAAEQLLLKQLSSSDISLPHALLCTNALCMLIIQRGDSELMVKVFNLLQSHRYGPNLLPLLCSCLESLLRQTKNPTALQIKVNKDQQLEITSRTVVGKHCWTLHLHSLHEWRSFSASLGFVANVSNVPSNFSRDLKHLDQTGAREVLMLASLSVSFSEFDSLKSFLMEVAVIYVADGQEDKQSILSNTTASPSFNRFVSELGWELLTIYRLASLKVCIGRGHEGYSGGLPYDTVAPYYATPDTELIFHVSTHLSGDATQKWKHIGNDEVHVVWSEHSRPYRRETIATKFCDVLIVLERVGDRTFRVRVETVSTLEFGPLYDGALVGSEELAEMVRLTVINASRAYRLAHKNHIRPLRHRELVFAHDTIRQMKKVRLCDAINSLYIPTVTT
ncbi:unnamed protein product [Angiostrongylus costaricensis]|uniref:Rap-GAP domain-containing protein n=1 Tax=Angiostrongylus costaricensis TaxID=334426 RepID=A0A158PEG0_ANGCS|nr:unnamed protein product [Angiostrongylus costaricensis]